MTPALAPAASDRTTLAPRFRADDADRLDVRRVVAALRRRSRLALAVLLGVVAATFLYTARQPYTYAATAEVVLNTREEQLAPATTRDDSVLPNAERADTEVEVLKSRALAEDVAAALHLERDPAFNPGQHSTPGFVERVRGFFGVGRGLTAKTLTPTEVRRAIIDKLQSGLTVARSDQTFVLDITYTTGSASNAARIANEYARQYAEGQLRRKTVGNQAAITFLDSRLASLRGQAQSDAERVQRYRIAHNLLSTSGSSLTEQEISSYNQAVTTARAQAAEDIARLNTARAQIRGGSNGGDAGEALSSLVVGGLRAREAEVSGRLATLTARYGSRYPDVAKTRSELADVQAQIRDEIARIISNLEARVMVSKQRLASLTGSLASARGSLADSNRAIAGLDDLDRRAKSSQALYETYLNRFKEVVAQEGTERPDARLLSRAEEPLLPSSPRILLSLALAAVLGGGLGIIVALIRELLFTGLTTADDVERRLGVAALGSLPRPLVDTAEAADEPEFAAAIRSLSETLTRELGALPPIIAVSAALPGEGIALTASCLARQLATGRRTILIACDTRDARVADALGITPRRPDLLDLLAGTASLDEALTVDAATGLSLLLIDPGTTDRPLVATAFATLLNRLRPDFDHIVIAAAPLLPVAVSRSLAALADVTIVVVRWRATADHAVRAALGLLSAETLARTGIVLTQVDMARQAKYGGNEPGSYVKRYRNYYP